MEIDTALMVTLLKKGYFQTSDFLMKNWFLKKGIDIGDSLQKEVGSLKAHLDKLVSSVSDVKKTHSLSPVFKWAQSEDDILMIVKFAHRFDSPGCIDVKNEKMTVVDNLLVFEAYCVQANQPIDFKLQMLLGKDVDGGNASWKRDSVGTAVLTIPKVTKGEIWRDLLDKSFKKPPTMKVSVWWEVKDAYSSAMNKFSEMLEEDDDWDM